MKHMLRWIYVLAGAAFLAGCLTDEPKEKKLLAINGFVLGDTEGVAKPLVVGVGDSVQRLVERNHFLGKLQFAPDEPLRLPLMTKVDVMYDDGDMRFNLGCATSSALDGDERFNGIETAGFSLCEPAINDWTVATRRVSEIINVFKKSNPNARDLKAWLQTASKDELTKLGGRNKWSRKFDIEVLTETQANERFAALPVGDAFDPELALVNETLINMGYFAGEKAIFAVGISKYKPFGGTGLTETQRTAVAYRVGVSFTLRADIFPKTKN
jgi:hypothetical protein